MRIIKIVLIILFLLFAAVQYNDNDPYIWIPIYGGTALMFIFNLKGWHSRPVIGLAILGLFIFSLTYIPGVREFFHHGGLGAIAESMKAETPYIEQTREFFGLWIAIVSLIFLYVKK